MPLLSKKDRAKTPLKEVLSFRRFALFMGLFTKRLLSISMTLVFLSNTLIMKTLYSMTDNFLGKTLQM